MVSTQDSESCNPSSNLGGTFFFEYSKSIRIGSIFGIPQFRKINSFHLESVEYLSHSIISFILLYFHKSFAESILNSYGIANLVIILVVEKRR